MQMTVQVMNPVREAGIRVWGWVRRMTAAECHSKIREARNRSHIQFRGTSGLSGEWRDTNPAMLSVVCDYNRTTK